MGQLFVMGKRVANNKIKPFNKLDRTNNDYLFDLVS